MIHILLLILKIIGIILLSVIGLLLTVLLVLLFVPVRYRISLDYHSHFTGRLSAGWLFRLIRLELSYSKEGFRAFAKVLFFSLYDSKKADKAVEGADRAHKHNKNKEKNVFDGIPQEVSDSEEMVSATDSNKEKQTYNAGKQAVDTVLEEKPEPIKYSRSAKEDKKDNPTKDKTVKNSKAVKNNKADKSTGKGKKAATLKNKLRQISCRINDGIKAAVANKNKLKAKTESIKQVINDADNKEMMSVIVNQSQALIKELMPVKYKVNVHYGFSDPYITGKLLVYISIIYGLSGVDMNITPDFDNEIIEGDIFLKGRIRIYKLLLIAFNIYRNDRFRELVLKR